jgi:hypothetical protein
MFWLDLQPTSSESVGIVINQDKKKHFKHKPRHNVYTPVPYVAMLEETDIYDGKLNS